MENKDFSFTFQSAKTPEQVYQTLLKIDKWWSGLYGEEISGNSKKLDDEFTFKAGNGVHYSRQKLVKLEPGKKIEWLVTDSALTFLKKQDEWTGTRISFDISARENGTAVTFTHSGLVPQIGCYNGCSGAWTKYLENLAAKL